MHSAEQVAGVSTSVLGLVPWVREVQERDEGVGVPTNGMFPTNFTVKNKYQYDKLKITYNKVNLLFLFITTGVNNEQLLKSWQLQS